MCMYTLVCVSSRECFMCAHVCMCTKTYVHTCTHTHITHRIPIYSTYPSDHTAACIASRWKLNYKGPGRAVRGNGGRRRRRSKPFKMACTMGFGRRRDHVKGAHAVLSLKIHVHVASRSQGSRLKLTHRRAYAFCSVASPRARSRARAPRVYVQPRGRRRGRPGPLTGIAIDVDDWIG